MSELADHIEAAFVAARQLPHDPGSPGEEVLANLARIRRDTQTLEETAAAADAHKHALAAARAELGHARTSHAAQHKALAAELDQAHATILELRTLHEQKIGGLGGVINEYHKQLTRLADELLKHR